MNLEREKEELIKKLTQYEEFFDKYNREHKCGKKIDFEVVDEDY